MTRDTARLLVEQALYLCQQAPGAGPWPADTWLEWARRADEWLRAEPVRQPLDVDRLVTEEMMQRAWTGVLHALPGPHQYPGDDVLRVAICSVAADLYERGRQDGRGDLVWHEERVRRECAAELRVRVRRMTSALIAVEHNLDQPYPDDPRWTPWSRFVEPEMKALRALIAEWAGQEEM